MPKVSVIVPIYGVEAYVERCARSLFTQTFDDVEFVFVNDCTTDNSMTILRKVIADYPNGNVVLVEKEQNEGLPQARKTGFEHAHGEYIIHLDSDDWMEPNTIEKLYNKAIETGADMVCCDWFEESECGRLNVQQKSLPVQQYFQDILCFKAQAFLWNRMCRRSLYEGIRFPYDNMFEDYVTTSQLLLNCQQVSFLPEALIHYNRLNVSSIRSTSNLRMIEAQQMKNILWVYEQVVPKAKELDIPLIQSKVSLFCGWMCWRENLQEYLGLEEVKKIQIMVRKSPNKGYSIKQILQRNILRLVYLFA